MKICSLSYIRASEALGYDHRRHMNTYSLPASLVEAWPWQPFAKLGPWPEINLAPEAGTLVVDFNLALDAPTNFDDTYILLRAELEHSALVFLIGTPNTPLLANSLPPRMTGNATELRSWPVAIAGRMALRPAVVV